MSGNFPDSFSIITPQLVNFKGFSKHFFWFFINSLLMIVTSRPRICLEDFLAMIIADVRGCNNNITY